MNYKRYLFFSLSVGLSIISLVAGFSIFKVFFGVKTAFLIATVLELLRLSSLYSISTFKKYYKFVALSLYVLVAIVCFTSATISFNADIIDKNRDITLTNNKTLDADLYIIKQTYSQKIDKEIKVIKVLLASTEKKYTAWNKSKTYKRRIDLYNDKINKLINNKEKFLNKYNNSNIDKNWILSQKAILNIDTGNKKEEVIEINGIEQATKEFLNIDKITFQKIIGISLAIVIEIGIILLMLISISFKKGDTVVIVKKKLSKNGVRLGRPPGKTKKRKVKKKKNNMVDTFFT